MLTINCIFLLLVTNLFFLIFGFYFLNQNLCFIYICEYLAAGYLCTMYVPGVHRAQKRVWDALELKLRMVVSHHVGAGN